MSENVQSLKDSITQTVVSSIVIDGPWNSDAGADMAILMDGEKGPVWVRSRDWAIYGRMYGWARVARIV